MAGRRYTGLVQFLNDGIKSYAICGPAKNLTHDRGGISVDQQPVTVGRVLAVSIRRARPDKFSSPHRLMLLCPDFAADIEGISLIHEVFEGQGDLSSPVVFVLAVILVIDGQESDTMQREILFNIISRINGAAAQPG